MDLQNKILNADFINHNTPIQKIEDPLIKDSGIKLFIKREDLNHPELSGNKWHKLKYNLIAAKENGYETLLTFGGYLCNGSSRQIVWFQNYRNHSRRRTSSAKSNIGFCRFERNGDPLCE